MNQTTDRILQAFPKGDPDLLFDQDGAVKLPRLTGLALSLAEATGKPITRQPTRERAEAVMGAVAERVAARGLRMQIRPGVKTETFGVFLVLA